MAFGEHAYSRIIGAAKIVLPLVALGILSLLFVLSRPSRQGEPLRFVDVGLEEMVQDEHLARPDYRSVTETGGNLRLKAEDMRPVPDTEGIYTGRVLQGWIDGSDTVSYTMTSETGRLNEAEGRAWLVGSVRLVRNDGHTALSEEIEIATDLSRLMSPGKIHAFGPLGTLDADSMEMLGRPDLASGTLTVFRGNVRLLYDPKNPEPEPQ